MRGECYSEVPLAGYTSWRVGGAARQLYRPADLEDLAQFLGQLSEQEPLLWLGLGSNLLVRDGGFAGTVIHTLGRINGITVSPSGQVQAGCGASCAALARVAARARLAGAAFLAGIPGTLGGALAMNAGAFGGDTWGLVREVTTIDRYGTLRQRLPSAYQVGYRRVVGPLGEWFVAATLALEPAAGGEEEPIRQLLARRAATQPIGQASCGSVFKNPPGEHAARLIEAAGLKGLRIGGAVVSTKHANFIINSGSAKAAEIEQLMERVRCRVAERFGIWLESEVRIVGEVENSELERGGAQKGESDG